MRYFRKEAPALRFALPSTKFALLGSALLLITVILEIIHYAISNMQADLISVDIYNIICSIVKSVTIVFLIVSILILIISLILRLTMSEARQIKCKVQKALLTHELGNPLHLKDGQRLPSISCKKKYDGVFELTINAVTATVDEIVNISSAISSCLNSKYERYAVTRSESDIAFNNVKFVIDDVKIDRSLTYTDVSQMKQKEPTKLKIQKGTSIDLTTSGSMLVAGKTRSGKTTAIISLTIQVLLNGYDNNFSEVIIIDPKRAELSMLPHTYTLDENGEATAIIEALKLFIESMRKRQKILNQMSAEKGDAVHWWEANMNVSILFIDEYVALRSILPKKASKDNPDYCLDVFDGLLKQIVTMGASAGCYAIISIAEASVAEGGLPALIRSACSTKILLKPTVEEARLMWDNGKFENLDNGRVYNAGDAWFSSTDGEHDFVSFVHFPYMNFPVYRELGRLLNDYYA